MVSEKKSSLFLLDIQRNELNSALIFGFPEKKAAV